MQIKIIIIKIKVTYSYILQSKYKIEKPKLFLIMPYAYHITKNDKYTGFSINNSIKSIKFKVSWKNDGMMGKEYKSSSWHSLPLVINSLSESLKISTRLTDKLFTRNNVKLFWTGCHYIFSWE